MKIKLNGKIIETADGKTLSGLIAEKKLNKDRVLASVNKEIIKGEDFPGTILSENDEVELFNFVSGG